MAEIYALSETVRAARLLVWRCEEMGLKITLPLCIQVDNYASIAFQNSTCLQSRVRGCIDMREGWVKELRDKEEVRTRKVNTDDNKADILTKCFPTYKFKRLVGLIRGHGHESERVRAFVARVEREYYE